MELLDRYVAQITEELKVSRLNVLEVQMLLPSKKHFWAAKLIEHKKKILALKKAKEQLAKAIVENKKESTPVALSKVNLDKMVEAEDRIKKINDEIYENETIVEYLEKVEKIFSAYSFDIKNIIEIIKMETL